MGINNGFSWLSLIAAASVGLSSAGCANYNYVGVKEGNFVRARVAPLACINNIGGLNGLSGKMLEGEIDGAPAVAVEGVGPLGGFDPVFTESRKADGMQVWVAGRYAGGARGHSSEEAALFEYGDRRLYILSHRIHLGVPWQPTTVDAIVARLKGNNVFAAVAAVDLDDAASQAAFEKLRSSRFTGTLVQGVLNLSAAAAAAGNAGNRKNAEFAQSLVELGDSVKTLIAASERPLFDANPKLINLLVAMRAYTSDSISGRTGGPTFLCVGNKPAH